MRRGGGHDPRYLHPAGHRAEHCMSKKALVWIGLTVGSAVGGYLPVLWGADLISFSSVILSAVGGIAGIWVGYRLGE